MILARKLLAVMKKILYSRMFSGIPFSNRSRQEESIAKRSKNLFPSNRRWFVYRSVIPEKLIESINSLQTQ